MPDIDIFIFSLTLNVQLDTLHHTCFAEAEIEALKASAKTIIFFPAKLVFRRGRGLSNINFVQETEYNIILQLVTSYGISDCSKRSQQGLLTTQEKIFEKPNAMMRVCKCYQSNSTVIFVR